MSCFFLSKSGFVCLSINSLWPSGSRELAERGFDGIATPPGGESLASMNKARPKVLSANGFMGVNLGSDIWDPLWTS